MAGQRPVPSADSNTSESPTDPPTEHSTLDWVIVGAGPIGVHVAVRLLADGGVSPKQLRIIDPGPEPLHRWKLTTASTGMRFLRSPGVHHLGESPFELVQFAGKKKRDRRKKSLFLSPYNRPSLDLFARHSDVVVKRHGLAGLHICDKVEHIALAAEDTDQPARLRLSSGRCLRARQIVLALGNSDHPHWPEEATRLRDAGGVVQHVFGIGKSIDPESLPDTVAILGGGISAAQLAVRVARTGRTVTVLARHEAREQPFDSDAGWVGPKYMRGFAMIPDYSRRRALIKHARHRGSMPQDVLRDLRLAMRHGGVTWQVGALTGGTVEDDGSMHLTCDGVDEELRAGALLLATGFSSRRPGGAMVDTLIAENRLPVADCGYPVVDKQLQWHPGLYTTGPLAELELGPVARNITGGRRAAERLVAVSQATARGSGVLSRVRSALATVLMGLLVVSSIGCQPSDDASKSADGSADTASSGGMEDTGAQDSGDLPPVDPLPPQGNLLIEEVYYTGAVPVEGIDRYYGDQFLELVNVADAPVMVGGLILGDLAGLAGAINPGDTPGGSFVADPDFVYLANAWRIPGAPEDVLLAPGASLVIAQDGWEHSPYSPVDLSNADYETYVEEYGGDRDDAIVPNLESIWYTAGYDWLVTVFGPTMVVLSIDADELEPAGGTRGPVKAPVSAVVDTMEALMDADSGDYKRLHSSVDSGFIHVSGTYTGESVRRRRDDSGRLIDTNDSGADFEVSATPEPGGARR